MLNQAIARTQTNRGCKEPNQRHHMPRSFVSLTKFDSNHTSTTEKLCAYNTAWVARRQTWIQHALYCRMATQMVHEIDFIEPDQERHEEYQYYVDKYCDTYPQLCPMIHDMVDHEADKTDDHTDQRRSNVRID